MKVKEIIRSINYDCFTLFFPKNNKLIETAKTFDIDFLELMSNLHRVYNLGMLANIFQFYVHKII